MSRSASRSTANVRRAEAVQKVLEIEALPKGGLDASAEFYCDYLEDAQALLAQSGTSALVILLPAAGPDHDDWRLALARDLARAHPPKRVNVVGADDDAAKGELLAYLRDAPGMTGQYLQSHE